jgi:hypothetical protein
MSSFRIQMKIFSRLWTLPISFGHLPVSDITDMIADIQPYCLPYSFCCKNKITSSCYTEMYCAVRKWFPRIISHSGKYPQVIFLLFFLESGSSCSNPHANELQVTSALIHCFFFTESTQTLHDDYQWLLSSLLFLSVLMLCCVVSVWCGVTLRLCNSVACQTNYTCNFKMHCIVITSEHNYSYKVSSWIL